MGRNTTIFDSNGLNGRILNIHHPWSNKHVFWDAGNGAYDRINKHMGKRTVCRRYMEALGIYKKYRHRKDENLSGWFLIS